MRKKGSALESSSSTDGDRTRPSGSKAAEGGSREPLERGSSDEESPTETSTGPPDRPSPSHTVGRLGRPHGLEGFLGIYIEDEDLVHLQPQSTVYIADRFFTIRAVRRGKKGYQVAFDEVTDRDGAEAIRGNDVHVSERRPLEDNEFWPEQLIGLEVRPGGGRVVAVNHGPAQDRLVVERDDTRFEVPFVDELVPTVDLGEGYVEIAEIEGLNQQSDRR